MSDLLRLTEFLKTSVVDNDKYDVNHVIDMAKREFVMITHKKDKHWQEIKHE